MVKDLGEELENLEEGVENLKNKEFRIFGIKMTAMTISAAAALVSSVIGGLYGAFVIYNDYMSMKEIILNIDVAAIDAKNQLIETKLDEAIAYTKDIKTSLKDDITRLETSVDRSEQRVKDAQTNIENGIESMTSDNNQLQKDVTESIREVEANNRTTEKDLRAAMRQLETDINQKLQEALNNPLSK
jgi:hypothetical protein